MKASARRALALSAVVLAAELCLLPGCGKKGEDDGTLTVPENYEIGGESLPAPALPEDGGVLWSVSEGVAHMEGIKSLYYTYKQLKAPSQLVQEYSSLLRGEDEGFEVVDNDLRRTSDLPDFASDSGIIRLAKESSNEGQVLEVGLNWSEDECIVSVLQRGGEILAPIQTPSPDVGGASGGGEMTMREAAEYLESQSPASLGLDTPSMDSVEVYAMSGTVMVDGMACIRLNVYTRENEQRTNHFLGSYLLSGDKAHLYRYDNASDSVTELTQT